MVAGIAVTWGSDTSHWSTIALYPQPGIDRWAQIQTAGASATAMTSVPPLQQSREKWRAPTRNVQGRGRLQLFRNEFQSVPEQQCFLYCMTLLRAWPRCSLIFERLSHSSLA